MENYIVSRKRRYDSDEAILEQLPQTSCHKLCRLVFKCTTCDNNASAVTLGYCNEHFIHRYRSGLQRITTQEEADAFATNSFKPKCKFSKCRSLSVDIGYCANHFVTQLTGVLKLLLNCHKTNLSS